MTWTYTNGPTSDSEAQLKKPSVIKRLSDRMKRRNKQGIENSDAAVTTATNSNPPADRVEGLFWPQDLLPTDFPACRILTFGYDSHVTRFFAGTASKNGIKEHGNDLLKRLEAARRDTEEPGGSNTVSTRKIIFIVHSLGGLVLKEVCGHHSS